MSTPLDRDRPGPGGQPEPEPEPVLTKTALEGVMAIEVEVDLNANEDTPSSTGKDSTGRILGPQSSSMSLDQGMATIPEATVDDETKDSSHDVDDLEGAPPSDSAATTTEDEVHTENKSTWENRKNVVILQSKSRPSGGHCTVYLVGTAHVSQESCDEVQAVIRQVQPQVVFIEACASRAALLLPQKIEAPSFSEMIDMLRKGKANAFGIAYSWLLSRYAGTLGIYPGAEFRVAYEEGLACGARVVLGDRPVEITLRRTWARMNAWQKTRLVFGMFLQGLFVPSAENIKQMVEEIKDTDIMTSMIQDMSKSYPSLMDTLVWERDLYMASTLRSVAEHRSTVVAVIGKGHLAGISEHWEEEISLQELLIDPGKEPSWIFRPVARWSFIAALVGGLAVFVGVRVQQRKSS